MANINDFGFPFTSVGGDREFGAAEWRDYYKTLMSDGVVDQAGNKLKVNPQAVANKTVYIDTGAIFIQGAVRVLTSVINLTSADNTSGYTRIDRIVARLNYADRKIEFVVKQGTPAASPVAPTLTRDATAWEISLAKITLANGYSTITSAVITDERSSDTFGGYAKSAYMQTFDDENNLLKYNRDVISVNANSIPTEVQYKRPADNTLFLKRVMSNTDSNGFYQTITETFYKSDGTTVYKTVTYTLTYFANGLVDTMTRVVS